MNRHEVTLEQVREAMKAVVEGKEEFVYNPDGVGGCFYVPATEDRCGHAFADIKLDYPQKLKCACIVGEVLKKLDVVDFNFASDKRITALWPNETIEQAEVARYLGAAQYQQDQGASWGQALAIAESTVREAKA